MVAIMVAFSKRVITHSSTALVVAMRSGWPFRHPSPHQELHEGAVRPHPPRRGGNFCHQAARREAQKPFAADDLFSSILGRARGRRLPWVRSKPVAHPRSKGRGAGWGHHAVLELLSTSMCPSSHTRRPPPSHISAR